MTVIAEWFLPALILTHKLFCYIFFPCPSEEGADRAALMGLWHLSINPVQTIPWKWGHARASLLAINACHLLKQKGTSKPPTKNYHLPIVIPDPWLGIGWKAMISRLQHFLYIFAFLTHFHEEQSVSSFWFCKFSVCYWEMHLDIIYQQRKHCQIFTFSSLSSSFCFIFLSSIFISTSEVHNVSWS